MIADWLGDSAQALRGTAIVEAGLVLVYFFISRVMKRVIAKLADHADDAGRRATTLWSMLRSVLIVAFALTGGLALLNEWDISIAPFLAVGSAIGLALGFGAQNLVRDVISGFFILAENQFKIGDVVRIAGVSGSVEEIRPRVTVLRDNEGKVHYVPNGEIKVATNLTQEFARVVIDVGVSHDESIDRAMDALSDEMAKLASEVGWSEKIIEKPEVLGVDALEASQVVIRLALKVVAAARWTVRREALARIKRRFDAEHISMPIPQVEIHRSGD